MQCQHCAEAAPFSAIVPLWLLTLAQELQQQQPAPRDLDVVEFFSGQGNLHRACCEAGLAAVGYDYQRNPEQNILCMAGLVQAISLLLRLKPRGLAWFAPQCSSWVFLAHSGHGRTSANNYEGRAPPSAEVTAGNSKVCIVSALLLLAAARGVAVVVEQPADSCMFKFANLRAALQIVHASSVRTWLSAFSESVPCPKPLVLWGTCRWLGALYRNKPTRKFQTEQIYTRGLDGRVTGGPLLGSTAAYPLEFGQAAATTVFSSWPRCCCHWSKISESEKKINSDNSGRKLLGAIPGQQLRLLAPLVGKLDPPSDRGRVGGVPLAGCTVLADHGLTCSAGATGGRAPA